jgi:hypothetical protein
MMIDRRTLLAVSLMAVSGHLDTAHADVTPRRLVLIHGRGQGGLNPEDLKAQWMDALKKGATAAGKRIPDEIEVVFPFYGDVLDKFAREFDIPLASDVQTRGGRTEDEFLAFQFEVAEALRQRSGVSDEQVDSEYGANPRPKGPLNWEWVQAILKALDKHGGGVSSKTLEIFTRDVFLYSTHTGVQQEIDQVVAPAITEEPTIVVAHSLGSVVAYNILRSDRRALNIPTFVTVGCPLAVRPIRDQFRPLRFPKPVKGWYNGFDPRDVVALYPLDAANFPVTPTITNYSGVKNATDNRHGISGYLDDPSVATAILSPFQA